MPLVCPLNEAPVLIYRQDGGQIDIPAVEDIAEDVEESSLSKGPPKATLARRAKSYSDFYDVVRAHIKKERHEALKEERKKSREQLRSEADFERWYSDVGQDLLEASHEEYRYGRG